MIPFMKYLEKANPQRQKQTEGGGGKWRVLFNVYRTSVWGDGKVLELDSGDDSWHFGCT